jgi:hypothetical protein
MRSLVDWSKELFENEEEPMEKEEDEKSAERDSRPSSLSCDLRAFDKELANDTTRFERQMMFNQQVCFSLIIFSSLDR